MGSVPAITALSVGAWLLFAAVRGMPPIDVIRSALSGMVSPATQAAPVPASGSAGTGTGTAPATGSVPPLENIGGPHRLAPSAAVAYRRASAMFGRPIPITDSYRTPEQQADCARRKPELCAPAGRSLHERGLAIDVHTGIVNPNDPRLVQALTATGWNRYAPTREPWHWSYGVIG
jgi:hypothetical protein